MTEFDPEKFRDAIYRAKLIVYMTASTDPKKKALLDHMKDIVNELQDYCDKLLDEEVSV